MKLSPKTIRDHRERIHTFESWGRCIAEAVMAAAGDQLENRGECGDVEISLVARVEPTDRGCHRIKVCTQTPLGEVCTWVHVE